jgi:predicted DNA-binding transcriptional regulator YafY
MYHPTTRVLAVLELLQTHSRMTGAELSTRLEVDIRTARRYITMLQDLGVPVVAERGRHGAYTLGSGYKLPPMMFTNDEALALTIGLLAARKLGLADAAPAVESAIAKVERVMPKVLRGQVRALSETIALDLQQPRAVPAGEVMLSLSSAAQAERRVHLHYRDDKGNDTERDFDPYGLGFRGGRWYTVGHCHLRRGLRSFRLDRVLSVATLEATFTRPSQFDAVASVTEALASLPRKYPVRVLLQAPLQVVQKEVPAGSFFLQPVPDGVVLHGRTDELNWMAALLARFECPFTIYEPEGLSEAVVSHAERMIRSANANPRTLGGESLITEASSSFKPN